MTVEQGIAPGEVARQMPISVQYLCDVRLGRRRISNEFLLHLDLLEIFLCCLY